jgi:small subunit ribosomal protein S30
MRGSTVRIKPLKYEQEYRDTPQYPPILDISYEARKKRMIDEWHEKIKSLKTVEEKLFEINVPRYYGWKPIMLLEESVPYNAVSFAQHVTRTHFREFKGLPHYSTDLEEQSHKLLGQIKPCIEEALIFEYKYRRYVFVVSSGVLWVGQAYGFFSH